MQGRSLCYFKPSFSFGNKSDRWSDVGIHSMISTVPPDKIQSTLCHCLLGMKMTYMSRIKSLDFRNIRCMQTIRPAEIRGVGENNQGELSDEDEDLCPVECVKEFRTNEEFFKILQKAKETDSLVVVDFYKTSCGSCKYIEQGFAKLCRGSGEQEAPVIFLKHNVMDEYDEPSEFAEHLRVKAVPLFQFYKDGVLLEAFPTRDKERISAAILKYSPAFQGF